MGELRSAVFVIIALLVLIAGLTSPVASQVGRQNGLIDPNIASEKELLGLPHLNATIVNGIMEKRPYLSMTDLNSFLSQSLDKKQLTELYGKMFIQINLENAPKEEILLIPGVGNRMLREFSNIGRIGRWLDSTRKSANTSTIKSWRGWNNTSLCRSI